MWSAKVVGEDGSWMGWADLPVFEFRSKNEEGLFRSWDAKDTLAERLPQSLRHLLKHPDAEISETSNNSLEFQAIKLWAAQAQMESRDFDWAGAPRLKAIEEGLALLARDTDQGGVECPVSTLAWHDCTGVVVPIIRGTEEIRLYYLPDDADEQRVERLRYRHATPQHDLETLFDWRGYFGNNSAISEGWSMMRRSGRGYVASFAGTTGFLVGCALRRLTRPAPTLEWDPIARRRLIGMEKTHSDLAGRCPDLSKAELSRNERAMVFVHGTLSCGIQGLKDLFPPGLPMAGPVYRFEHDTFQRVETNAHELVTPIKERLSTNHLLLAAHSRGGLVAKLAATLLRRGNYPGSIEVHTFGTPHLGTPLVGIGKKTLNVLYKLGEDMAASVPIPMVSALAKGFSYVVDSPTLPPGIEVMSEESEALSMLQRAADSSHAWSWSSTFNVDGADCGFGPTTMGLLQGAMRGRRGDLVVPTASAMAFGVAAPVLACSHLHYFQQPAVQDDIKNFFNLPVAQLPRTPAPPVQQVP